MHQFDITEFGAVGDGVCDCTEAVQKALDAAENCQGSVIVPPGRYRVGALKLRGRGVSLIGTPAWSFRGDGASIFCLNDASADCLLDISGAFGCTVHGMCFDGAGLGENVHGIQLYWEEYNGGGEEDTPTVDDCRIGNFSGDGLHFEHVWCFSVRHCMLHRNGGAGLFMDGWDAFILDNWFSLNQRGGILGGEVVASITCTGNRVEWNRGGGFILPCGDSYNITGNFFDRSFGPALDIGGAGGVHTATVTGNIFRRSGALAGNERFEEVALSAHVRMRNCTGCVVSANSMRTGIDDDGGGVCSPDYSFVIEDCTDCIVKDNAMHKGAVLKNIVLAGENPGSLVSDNLGRAEKEMN